MPEITALTAPLLLGPLLSTFLYGILTVQLYFYSISFPSDAVYIKLLVWGVYALDTATTIMTISDTYQWLAKGFGNSKGLDNVLLSPIYTPIMGPIIAGTVQMFYGYRIFKIERKAWPVSVFIIVAVLTQIGAGLWSGIIALQTKSFHLASVKSASAPWLIILGAVVTDITIAVTLIFLLARRQSSIHQQMHGALSKIMQLTAETNLLSTLVNLTTLILFTADKGTLLFTLPSFVVGKVYSNSLLLILNNRWYLAAGAQKGSRGHLGSSQIPQTSGTAVAMNILKNNSQGAGRSESKGIHVEVNTLVEDNTEQKASAWIPDSTGYRGIVKDGFSV